MKKASDLYILEDYELALFELLSLADDETRVDLVNHMCGYICGALSVDNILTVEQISGYMQRMPSMKQEKD